MSLIEDIFVVDLGSSGHQNLLFGTKQAVIAHSVLNKILSHLASTENQLEENLFANMLLPEQDTEFRVRWFRSEDKRVHVSLHLSPQGIVVTESTKKTKLHQWDFSKLKDWKVIYPDKIKLTVKEWIGSENQCVFECYDANSVFETIGKIVHKEFQRQQQCQQDQNSLTWASVLSPGAFTDVSSLLSASIGNSISGLANKAIEGGSEAADNMANSIGDVLATIALQVPVIAQRVQVPVSVNNSTSVLHIQEDDTGTGGIGLTDSDDDGIVDIPIISDDGSDTDDPSKIL